LELHLDFRLYQEKKLTMEFLQQLLEQLYQEQILRYLQMQQNRLQKQL
jgi:hypothetical protein